MFNLIVCNNSINMRKRSRRATAPFTLPPPGDGTASHGIQTLHEQWFFRLFKMYISNITEIVYSLAASNSSASSRTGKHSHLLQFFNALFRPFLEYRRGFSRLKRFHRRLSLIEYHSHIIRNLPNRTKTCVRGKHIVLLIAKTFSVAFSRC